jgi:hypothetical protein
MMNNSQNGDGKSRAPINRIAEVAKKSATPAEAHENEIIAAVAGRYDQIDALWLRAEEDLRRFRLHTVVCTLPFESFSLDPNDFEGQGDKEHHCLGFLRYGKSWRICHGVYRDLPPGYDEEPHWTPISDCSMEMRIKVIPVFQELRQKVIESVEQTVPKLDAALANFRRLLDR